MAFQFDIITSSPSTRPYEHPSSPLITSQHLLLFSSGPSRLINSPAPNPFSPFSNSSSRRKFLGTLATIFSVRPFVFVLKKRSNWVYGMRCDARYGRSLKSEVDYLGGVAAVVGGEFAGCAHCNLGWRLVTVRHVRLSDVV